MGFREVSKVRIATKLHLWSRVESWRGGRDFVSNFLPYLWYLAA